MNWQRFFRKQNNELVIRSLLQSIEEIRGNSSILVLVPGTTGYNWMGVNRATRALFPTTTVELPQYYSNSIFTKEEQHHICKKIQALEFEQILFSGFPAYFGEWMKQLKQNMNQISLIYHGFFSELAGNLQQSDLLKQIIELNQVGILDKIAFNKKGMAESIHVLCGIETYKIVLKTPIFESVPEKKTGIHVGVLGNDQFRKNLHNQVVAASLIPDSIIHVTTDTTFPYLPQATLQRHMTGQSHKDFTNLLGSMHLNLHLSYSESWGQLTTESLAMGVPCLVSYHSDVFDYDDALKKKLVVSDYDNSWAIFEQAKKVLQDEFLPAQCRDYVQRLNQISNDSVEKFLQA